MQATDPTPRSPKTDYLTFFIAGEEYGVPILRVREIIGLDVATLTRVPAAPRCVRSSRAAAPTRDA